MAIIDAHAHVFPEARGIGRGTAYGRVQTDTGSIQLLPPFNERVTYTPEMLIANLDWAGIERAVLLQGPFYGECNDYAREAIQRYPNRLHGAAYLDPWQPDAQAFFQRTFAEPGFVGVKLECSEGFGLCRLHADARLDDGALAWLWEALDRRGLTLTFDLGAVGSRSYQTEAVRQIATSFPSLKIVICHLAQPSATVEADPDLQQAYQAQLDLGLLPNVWFDTSALPAYLPEQADRLYPDTGRYIRAAVERLGPKKLLWGSDQPGLLTHASLPQLVRMAKRDLSFLAADDQARILAGNAADVYGIS